MMAPVFLVVLAAASVVAAAEDKDYDYADRIIEGHPGGIESFPFMAGLIYTKSSDGTIILDSLCGGTILNEYWVLTSAYCAGPMKLSSGENGWLSHVRAGTSHINTGGVMLRVLDTVSHENPPHNIALIQVQGPWPLNGVTIDTARLPRQGAPIPVNKLATIMGWGSAVQGGMPSQILLKEEVLVISVSACNDRVSSWTNNEYGVTDINICTIAHPMKKLSSVYRNDYGSPVLVDGEVVGIVSWYISERPTFLPNVHTRVSLYIDWISEIVGPLSIY